MSEQLMKTDSNGTRYGSIGESRRNSFIDDEEDEEEITNSVWFSDN